MLTPEPPGPKRPVLAKAQIEKYAKAAVLGDWADHADHPLDEPDIIVDPRGVNAPPHRFQRIQDAISHILHNPQKSGFVIGLASGQHEGPVYIPTTAPALTLVGLSTNLDAEITASVDAEMPGHEYRQQFGALFTHAHNDVKTMFEAKAALTTLTTGNACVLQIDAAETTVRNLTVRNTYNCDRAVAAPAGALIDQNGRYPTGQHQAVAIKISGADKVVLDNVKMSSFQDTLYLQTDRPKTPNRVYLKQCEIEGDVDFIFGASIAFFDRCTIRSLGSRAEQSWATAPSTNIDSPYGFVFDNCDFIHDDSENAMRGEMLLGRQLFQYVRATPYGTAPNPNFSVVVGEKSAYAEPNGTIAIDTLEAVGKCVLIHCRVGSHINTVAPWGDWSGGKYSIDGVWQPSNWHPRYRPFQTGPQNFKDLLKDWLAANELDYSALDDEEAWLAEYGTD